ncbi:MAG TPA: hypothetical protein VEX64_03880, partial [Pyrinomonadaceae bacterium]|nr:hypothetical protein [Pyrinomonadaceae bacterium]
MKKGLKAERKRGLLLSFLTLGLVGTMAILPTQFNTKATVSNQEASWRTESHVPGMENYDIRTDRSVIAIEALTGFRAASGKTEAVVSSKREEIESGEKALQSRIPSLKVEYTADLRNAEVIAPKVDAGRSTLTAPAAGKRSDILRSFVK